MSGPTSGSVFNLKHESPGISMLVALQLPCSTGTERVAISADGAGTFLTQRVK